MASYGELLHSISTASINSLLRERGFTTWAYFVNQFDGQSGVVFANDKQVALYVAADRDKLKLGGFGIVPIADVRYVEGESELVLSYKKSDEAFGLILFTDPSLVEDDEELSDRLESTLTDEWRQYLLDHGMQKYIAPRSNTKTVIFAVIVVVIIAGFIWFLNGYKPQQ